MNTCAKLDECLRDLHRKSDVLSVSECSTIKPSAPDPEPYGMPNATKIRKSIVFTKPLVNLEN